MKIIYDFKEPVECEVGDVIVTENEKVLLLISHGEYLALVNLEEHRIVKEELNHPVHAINHIKKHYGKQVKIYKADEISLKLGK